MELKTFFAQDLLGNVIPSPTAYLYLPGTTTLATGLKNETGGALANPWTGNVNGKVAVAAPDGDYDLRVTGAGRDSTMRVRFIDSVAGSADILRLDLAGTGAGKGSRLLGDGEVPLADYAALRSFAGPQTRVYITGALGAAKPAGIAGTFQLDPSDTTSADNGGTIIVGASGRRWKRDFNANIHPEWFGASGGGVADDGAAFSQSLSTAVSAGRALELSSGATYQLTTFSAFVNTGTLRIIGNGATIRGPGGVVDFLSPASNFSIYGVRFTNWSGVVSRLAAQSGAMTEVRFTNNWVTSCTGICINIERPIESYWIDGNSFENCSGGYVVRIGENTFANQNTWLRGWIRENRVRNITGTGTTSAAAFLIYGREATISDNKIDGVAQTGDGEAWGIYTKVRYGQVIGNTVQNVTTASNTDLVGINIKGTTRPVTASPQGFAVCVIGNHVRGIGVVGSRGVGIRGQTDDVLISNNQCDDCGGVGIVADESAVHRNVSISDNLVSYASVIAGTVGIRIEGAGTGDSVDQNKITNAQTGIVARTGPSGTMADARVSSNLIVNSTFNIVFDSFPGCTLSRLVIDNNAATGGTFGVLYNGSAGSVTGLRLRNNDLSRAATPVSGSLGTSPIVFGNSGFLSSSGAWDPPSIASGASASTTLTVGGAAVGDMVEASFSNPLGGLALSAQVSAANAVEVRLSNSSGAAVDLASGTVRVQVVKSGL